LYLITPPPPPRLQEHIWLAWWAKSFPNFKFYIK
jgi:hypothetical protein